VEGVTNLRGTVLPVIDLRKRFCMEPREATRDSRIIVAALGGVKTGMIVDGVSEVLRISDETVEPTPAMVSTIDTAYIVGIAKVDKRLVILLDLSKVLSLNEQLSLGALPVAA
jgi:purine-binding chemotaxis protein CheW